MMSARAKFSVMMFLEFFIWGAWFPLASDYLTKLGFGGRSIAEIIPMPHELAEALAWLGMDDQKSWILNAFALASLTALFFSTQFADRNFAAERFLAASHLIGGLAILGIGVLAIGWIDDNPTVVQLRDALGLTSLFWPILLLMLIHSLFYVPTISITNSIAFANLQNPQQDFGPVRLWGTIGWIAASLPFVFILADWDRIAQNVGAMENPNWTDWLGASLSTAKEGQGYLRGVSFTYVAAGVASLVLAAFSMTLPHTPPRPAKGGETFAWLEAIKLLNRPFLFVLFVVTFLDAAVHQGYFVMTGSYLINKVEIPAQWVMPVMTIGQFAEIATMAVLGLVLKRLGWKTTMIVGVLGHAARFSVFAFFPYAAPAIAINVMHGICYAFFFATVYIFVDEFFPKDARASAQGLFNFLILGFGSFIGNLVWPKLETRYTTDGVVDYGTLFLFPAGVAFVAALLLLLFFNPPAHTKQHQQAEEDFLAPTH